MSDKYEDKVGSIFLYSHEAHPGEHYPQLTSMAQKLNHARDLRDNLGVTRTILIDALDGACHRAYGSMPNMTWLINRAGTILYKSDWTDVTSVDRAVEYFLSVNLRRREGQPLAPFRVERLDYRVRDMEGFNKGLEHSGPKAVKEFAEAFE
ncbi:MAG: hypothetical protein N2D54_02580 [Chloroflexota bacterium]